MQLKDLLRPNGLLPFLQQYPDLFEVTLTGPCNRKNKPMFTFKVHGDIGDALLQVGGGSSSEGSWCSAASRAPAVGGTASTTPPPPPGLPPHAGAAEHQPQPLAVQQAAPAPAGPGTVPAQAAPEPAVGGAAPVGIPVGPVSSWTVDDMVTYLDAIALGHLNRTIRENGLDGAFFLECPQEELQGIGIGPVQWKKIKLYMPQGQVSR